MQRVDQRWRIEQHHSSVIFGDYSGLLGDRSYEDLARRFGRALAAHSTLQAPEADGHAQAEYRYSRCMVLSRSNEGLDGKGVEACEHMPSG